MTAGNMAGRFIIAQTASLPMVLALVAAAAGAEPVTFAELRGTVIDFTSVVQEKVRQEGRLRFPRVRTVGRIAIGPGDEIVQSFENSVFARDGRRVAGDRRSPTDVLGAERETKSGEHIVWLFSDESLTRLRVFEKGGTGGQRMTFTFARGSNGLNCAVSMRFAYEENAGIHKTPIGGSNQRIEILDGQQTSSSCRVTSQLNTTQSKHDEHKEHPLGR
jgi:hypothetical protein